MKNTKAEKMLSQIDACEQLLTIQDALLHSATEFVKVGHEFIDHGDHERYQKIRTIIGLQMEVCRKLQALTEEMRDSFSDAIIAECATAIADALTSRK